jgi:signal transduction histidine kinase/CheY-like chemotaxis protein
VSLALTSLVIRYEQDVVLARQQARHIARLVGFDTQDQTRVATAVSEIARNAFEYARSGRIEFSIEGTTRPQVLVVRISDRGPGIRDLDAILAGRYRSPTGMGVGIVGAQRLMDGLDVLSAEGTGTTVVLKKLLPASGPLLGGDAVARVRAELLRQQERDPVEEVKQQNQELLRTLDELTQRSEELAGLNRELEDTNRGVLALYAELDEKAEHLRRADEIKTRFISNLSHEFRTPVNSIQALARLLLDRTDGNLTGEQERQVHFIRRAADALSELVNDLLDLAKAEAGKLVVHAVEFEVENLFGALRGMLRPLLVSESVALVFEDPEGVPPLYTDEGKLSQILRNFISNALKFTERGEVRVSARLVDGASVRFEVADTGIGIAPEDQERIFQEFAQVDSPLQRRVKGTGLGLPLTRKLAALLGGHAGVVSEPGVGSTFYAVIPVTYAIVEVPATWEVDAERVPVLVVEDEPETLLVYEKFFAGSAFQMLAARTLRDARSAVGTIRPRAVVLDLLLRGEDSWGFLTELKRRDDTRDIPVVVVTTVEDQGKGAALGADAYFVKPVDRQTLLHVLTRLTSPETIRRILIVDDEEIARYVLRQHLTAPRHVLSEAASGSDAIRCAREEHPDVICLDLTMPGTDGVAVLRLLKDDPATSDIPVVVVTSRVLDDAETRELLTMAAAVLPKEAVSRERAIHTIDEALRVRAA